MRFFNFVVYAVLLFTTPTLLLYPNIEFSLEEIHADSLPFDEFLNLIDELESGELEKRYTQDDFEKMVGMLANVARQGLLPNASDESRILEEDIEELLNPFYSYADTFFYDQGEVILCRNWAEKKWHQAKKFLRKHRKAILIGAAVVVAAAIAVCAVAAASTAAAIGAAAASSDEEKEETECPHDTHTPNEAPILQAVLDEQITSLKELAAEDHFLENENANDPSLGEQVRRVGAEFAHQILDGIAELTTVIPQLTEELKEIGNRIVPECLRAPNLSTPNNTRANFEKTIATGHERIDRAFSVHNARGGHRGRSFNDNLITGEIPLPIPGNFAKKIDASKFREAIQASQKSAIIAEELGFSAQEITHLQKSGSLDKVVASTFENLVSDKAMLHSLDRFKKAETFLKPYGGKYLPEMQIRELIHQTGIKTFPRPNGIPENYRIKLTNKSGGMKYVHPDNEGTYVRIMPGKPHSPYPHQKEPYVNHRINGSSLDKFGKIVANDAPEAHIPINEFIYRE